LKTSFKINTLSELKTISLEIINLMKENKIFLFYGDMGSGKTTLIGEVCKAIGIDHHSSPTYGIINQYLSPNFGDIFHIDCYRFIKEFEAINSGLMELIDENEYCFIEWPEKIQNLLPENCVRIHLEVQNNTREITFNL
tara:strand:- start:6696 stop:7112 length:417 start_codon:yes stop_codon:yes gene_type:complete